MRERVRKRGKEREGDGVRERGERVRERQGERKGEREGEISLPSAPFP